MTTHNIGAPTSLNGHSPRANAVAPHTVAPRGRRRPALFVLGAVGIGLGALFALWLVTSAGDRTSVLRMARDVPFGTRIVAGDVATVQVAVDPSVATVPAGDAASLVGMVAATNLLEGSLLAPGEVTAAGPLGAGEVLVPLPVPADRAPVDGLQAGSRVLIVDTPAGEADPPTTTPRTLEVEVLRVGVADLNGVFMVDVAAREADAPAVAARASTGRFALIVLNPTGQAGGAT